MRQDFDALDESGRKTALAQARDAVEAKVGKRLESRLSEAIEELLASSGSPAWRPRGRAVDQRFGNEFGARRSPETTCGNRQMTDGTRMAKMALLVGGGPSPGINGVIKRRDH